MAIDKLSSHHNKKLKRILLFVYGVLILLMSPIMIRALFASSEWQEKLLWSLALLFGIPTAVMCLVTAKKGSDDEVKQALRDLNSD